MAAVAVTVLATVGVTVVTAAPAAATTPLCGAAVASLKATYTGPTIYPTYDRVPVVSSTNLTGACNLYRGAANNPDVVKVLQEAINVCYFDDDFNLDPIAFQYMRDRYPGFVGLAVDGSFGPKTENAVRAVQTAEGVTPDGWFGQNTRATMLWLTNMTDAIDCGDLVIPLQRF